MASRRRQPYRRHRLERRLLWGSLVVAAVLATMLATGFGVRQTDQAAAPATSAPPVTSTSAAPPPGAATASVTTATVAPSTTAPADLACSAVASILELTPVHTHLSASVRAASESPRDDVLAARAMATVDEYRSLHLARFLNSLGQLAGAEPSLAAEAELIARVFEAGLMALDRAGDGTALAAASRDLVGSPELPSTVEALMLIHGYGADRCALSG